MILPSYINTRDCPLMHETMREQRERFTPVESASVEAEETAGKPNEKGTIDK